MTISVVGHGYVGIVAACVFADFGNHVYVIGHTKEKLEKLKGGDPLIYEPGLAELLQKNIKAKRLTFTDKYDTAIPASEIVFICVGTPPKPDTGEADLSTVYHVAEHIGKHLSTEHFTVVSCKSTVPVGTNLKVKEIVEGVKPAKAEFAVASCPEFLREGTGIHDTLNPDRTIIGAVDKRAIELLLAIHEPLPGKRVITNIASAELIKYASNSMLATKISFGNLIALYAEHSGADVEEVLEAVGLDNRIGRKFLYPGIGYGGACFPKDVQALTATGREIGVDVSLLEAVEHVNFLSWQNMVLKVLKHAPEGATIGVWGLSFKPNTDDIRFAPSVKIINALLEKGYKIKAYDQAAAVHVKKTHEGRVTFCENPYEVVDGADALIIMTEWNEFKQADLSKVKKLLKNPIILDGRNIYEPKKMKDLGFTYVATGR